MTSFARARWTRAGLLAAMLASGPTLLRAADAPTSAPTTAPAPRIVIEPAGFDFGRLRPGGSVEKEFLVRNHGTALLTIQSLVTSCGCTAAVSDSTSVKPGATTVVRVRLVALDEAGPLRKSVLVKSNDPAQPTIELKIEAVVTGKPSPRPRT
jgi:hypothetical protein